MLDVTQCYLQKKNNNFRVVAPPVLFQNKTRGGRSRAQHARRKQRVFEAPPSAMQQTADWVGNGIVTMLQTRLYGWQQKLSFQTYGRYPTQLQLRWASPALSLDIHLALYAALDKLFACFLRRCKALVHHRDSSLCVFVLGGGAIVPMGGEKAEVHSTKTKSTQRNSGLEINRDGMRYDTLAQLCYWVGGCSSVSQLTC